MGRGDEGTVRRRVLVVTGDPTEASPYLADVVTRLRAGGIGVSLMRPPRARSELTNAAGGHDVVLTDPATLRRVQRAHLGAPLVLVAEAELLGSATRRLPVASLDLAIAASEAAAAPLRWRGIETVVVAPAVQGDAHGGRAPAPRLVIGCASRFDAGAGLDVLLDAFAQLPRSDVSLELVNVGDDHGRGDDRVVGALRARAARPDLDGRVTIIDRVDDRRALMRRWRVAVTPNVVTNGAALPLREAIALGVPVVATDRGANAEIVGDRGIVVRPGRPAELARALAHALDEPVGPVQTDRVDRGGAPDADRLLHVVHDVARRGARRRAGTIVFVVPDYEPTLGGTTRQTQNQARELHARGYDVLVLTQRVEPHWARAEMRDGIRLRRIGPSGRTVLRMKLLVLSVALWLRKHRREIGVVNAIMYPDFVVSAALAGLGSRTVMCWAGLGDATDTVGTLGPLRAPLRAARRRALSRAAQVALTPALRDELDRLALGHDVSIIPTPVDVEAFRPPTPEERADARRGLGIADDELVVAYTGHLRALKRVERLVEAFGLLVASGRPARLLLVGSPRLDLDDRAVELEGELGRVAERDRVIITGAVSDVRLYLHAADAFVLPSDREGLSNSLLEALAAGVPVVAPASAAGDQVLDDSCGIVPRSNDATDLYAALARLADDPDYRAKLAVGARQAAERFALARVMNAYEALYARLRATRTA